MNLFSFSLMRCSSSLSDMLAFLISTRSVNSATSVTLPNISNALSRKRVSGFLDSPAGRALVNQHAEGWSPWLAPQLKAYGLRSAILKASRQEALSAAGVVAALPVRFWLPQTTAEARRTNPDPVCPAQCGDSVLAHLAFLMASLQVGAMGR